MNAQVHARVGVQKIVLVVVKKAAQQVAIRPANVNAKKSVLRLVPIVVLVIARANVPQHVPMLVKPRHHNTAQIVQAIVLLGVLPHVLMLVRGRHRKAVLIVLHNVVGIVSMNVPMVVDVSVTHHVVGNAKESVAEHAR